EDGRRRRRQPREAALDDFFFAIAFGSKLRYLGIASWKTPDCRENAEEFEAGIAFAELREQRLRIDAKDPIIRFRRDRQHGVEVARAEGAIDVLQRDFLPLEHRAVG